MKILVTGACGDLGHKPTWEISALATMQQANRSVRHCSGQFSYASSGSVYGVSAAEQETENFELRLLSEDNKTKMVSERVLLSDADRMAVLYRDGALTDQPIHHNLAWMRRTVCVPATA